MKISIRFLSRFSSCADAGSIDFVDLGISDDLMMMLGLIRSYIFDLVVFVSTKDIQVFQSINLLKMIFRVNAIRMALIDEVLIFQKFSEVGV